MSFFLTRLEIIFYFFNLKFIKILISILNVLKVFTVGQQTWWL